MISTLKHYESDSYQIYIRGCGYITTKSISYQAFFEVLILQNDKLKQRRASCIYR